MFSKDGKWYGRKRQTGHDEKGGGHCFNMAPEAMCMSAWTQTQSYVVQPLCISHAENEIEATICWPWGAGRGRETSSVLYQSGSLLPEIREALLTLETELHWRLAGCAVTMPCGQTYPVFASNTKEKISKSWGLKQKQFRRG